MPFVPGPQESVEKLSIERLSDQAISALKVVRLTSDTTADIAESTLTYADASAVGIATSSAIAAGLPISILTYGVLEDAFFAFPLNDVLFLGTGGTITNVAPTLGAGDTHNTIIGRSLGAGAIFINVREPIGL